MFCKCNITANRTEIKTKQNENENQIVSKTELFCKNVSVCISCIPKPSSAHIDQYMRIVCNTCFSSKRKRYKTFDSKTFLKSCHQPNITNIQLSYSSRCVHGIGTLTLLSLMVFEQEWRIEREWERERMNRWERWKDKDKDKKKKIIINLNSSWMLNNLNFVRRM